MLNEDDVNEEADSGQSDGEENGEVEQAPVIQQPQHQVNYYNAPIQGQALNGVANTCCVIPASVPVQQLPPEQIPVPVQQHVVSNSFYLPILQLVIKFDSIIFKTTLLANCYCSGTKFGSSCFITQ